MIQEILEEETSTTTVAEPTPEYPKHTELADFFIEDGRLACTLNIDFKDFDVSHEQYFKGNDEYSEAEYEAIYSTVASECNKSGEYTIDCYKGRYTVRKTADIDTIRYNDMTDDEKAEHDLNKKNKEINNRRYERDSILREKVDPVVSNPLRWESLSEEEKENYKNYRLYLLNIPQQENFPNEEILSFEGFVISRK